MTYSWELATISDFKPLEDPTGWLQCPNCNEQLPAQGGEVKR